MSKASGCPKPGRKQRHSRLAEPDVQYLWSRSPRLIEQSLCPPQIVRVEALGKASVDRREKIARLFTFVLIHPQLGGVHRCPKFKRFGVLASCRGQSLV